MKKILFPVILLVVLMFSFRNWQADPATQFLKSLSPELLKKTQLAFDDSSREAWHFFPASMWPRPGVQFSELDAHQKDLLSQLLQAYLSESGYAKTQRIIELENVLKEMGGDPVMRDATKYSVVFYGQPAKDSLWAWSFEGHHISLNFTVLNDKVSMAPRFLGANPAMIPSGPRKGERILAKEEDLGFALVNSLSPEQAKKTMIKKRDFNDIKTSNDSKVAPLAVVGIRLKELNKSQQQILMDLINEYLATMSEPLAQKRMKQLQAEELTEIRFAWAGSTQAGSSHYYRVQGASFLIEFDNTQGNANHIHTVWRDFDGDFGRDLIREHYQHSGHH